MVDLKLLVLSDIHGDSSTIIRIKEEVLHESITALIVCGDITHFGSLVETTRIIDRLINLGVPVFFVPGNCDPKELSTIPIISGAVNLHRKYREIEGIGLLGIGGSPIGPFHTPFEMSEKEMRSILEEITKGSTIKKGFILITHAPPKNTKVDLVKLGIHTGSQAIRDFIEREKPALVLCGHIHEARGTDTIGNTLIVNPGPANKCLYATIDINEQIQARLKDCSKKG